MEKIKITCYGKTKIWTNREKAMEYFLEGMCACEGSEAERYTNIYCQLMRSETDVSDMKE